MTLFDRNGGHSLSFGHQQEPSTRETSRSRPFHSVEAGIFCTSDFLVCWFGFRHDFGQSIPKGHVRKSEILLKLDDLS